MNSICNLKYNVPRKTPIVFCGGCNYYYHFIIKELLEQFEITRLGKITEKYIMVTVLKEKESSSNW